ncbi:MAG: hypothetical protein DRI57_21605 [Deltaproteobacteria bacterium]|nr:MAG: hypothetical protein DRI57_21605 [Deltaproteobacteria bacterium]
MGSPNKFGIGFLVNRIFTESTTDCQINLASFRETRKQSALFQLSQSFVSLRLCEKNKEGADRAMKDAGKRKHLSCAPRSVQCC